MKDRRIVTALVVLTVGLGALSGCDSAGSGHPSPSVTKSAPSAPSASSGLPGGLPGGLAGGDGESQPASSVAATPTPSLSSPGAAAEVTGTCPYISAAAFADAEGDRVGRVTVLQTVPVGCRFYFASQATTIVGEISVQAFPTATSAFNAMVISARDHPEQQSDATVGDGSVAFKTDLQGTSTWQCVFAKDKLVVVVRTRQPSPAANAFNLARTIAPAIS